MGKFPSEEQRRVIEFDGNTIVAAGAGSGKTKTMIARIVRKICEGVSLDKMLIVTYMRAAAADIKLKLTKALNECKPTGRDAKKISGYIRDALIAIPVANIGTLHSYCQKLIKTYFFAAGLDPSSPVMEEAESDIIKGECIRAAVAAAKKTSDRFCTICDMLTGRKSDRGAEEAVKKIVAFALSMPDPDSYLNLVIEDGDCFAELDRAVAEQYAQVAPLVEEGYNAALAFGEPEIVKIFAELRLYLAGEDVKFSRKPSARSYPAAATLLEDFAAAKTMCNAYRKFADSVKASKTVNSAPYAATLCDVARDALVRYAAKKAELGKLDYSDLEHGGRRILADDKCAKEILSRIDCVFIDEYQDVSPLQAEIAGQFQKGGATMFLVGDIKQSIFGFRRCDPKFFAETLSAAADYEEGRDYSGYGGYVRFYLNGNFRSSQSVINFVNSVFGGAMTEECGGVNYDDNNKLICNSDEAGSAKYVVIDGKADVVMPSPSGEKPPSAAGEANAASPPEDVYSVINSGRRREADAQAVYVANCVLGYIKDIAESAKRNESRTAEREETEKEKSYYEGLFGSTDKDNDCGEEKEQEENEGYGSIAILVRSARTEFCEQLADILGRCGVPCFVGKRAKISDFPEVVALLDIARCIDDGHDDIALYTALRSPMGAFSDGELLKIAKEGASALYSCGAASAGDEIAFYKKAEAYTGEYRARLDAFFAERKRFSLYAKCHDAADTLGYITSEINYFQHVYDMADSATHAAAVEALISLAASGHDDLHSFITMCSSADLELSTEGGGDSVTIMTEHSAKGLEYNYVIVAECDNLFNMRDISSKVIVTSEGVAIVCPVESELITVPSAPYLLAKRKGRAAVVSEEMRLFYVALTRAKKDLLVVGRSGTDHPPAQATCARNFVLRAPDEYINSVAMPHTEEECAPAAESEKVRAAVAERCAFAYPRRILDDGTPERIDAASPREEEICTLPVKTYVTAIAEAVDEGSEADVLTADDVVRGIEYGPGSKTPVNLTADEAERLRERALLRGTAYHRAMELIDFENPDFERIKHDVENAELVDAADIERAAADIYALTKDARFVARERYFIVDVPAAQINMRGEGNVLVQGVIDLLIVDGKGNATIIDYKTTAVDHLDTAGYRTQLRLYAEAVERSTPFRVTRTCLYSFTAGFMDIDIY